jgi:uncharacterized membrane protein YeaQ/YmgE (transglycosylase-associated protein family)
MDLVLWVLFGAIAAWIAAIFIGTNTRYKVAGSIALGVMGAVLAGATMQLLTGHSDDSVNYYSLLLATASSLFLVVVVAAHKKV